MRHKTYTIHPEITKILGQFCEEVGLEKPTPPTPPHIPERPRPPSGDIDKRLIDYSKEYVEYKPGHVQERNS